MKNIITFFKLCGGFLATLSNSLYFNVELIKPKQLSPQLQAQLQTFEQEFTYPFSGEEDFTIMHGNNGDYLSFFKNLGTPYFYRVTYKNKLHFKKQGNAQEDKPAAAGCAILRTLRDRKGNPITAWYLCDLKVKKEYRGNRLPLWLMQQVALPRFWQCPRGYAICMNPSDNNPRAAKIFKEHGPIAPLTSQQLNLYTLTKKEFLKHKMATTKALKMNGYMTNDQQLVLVSTAGMKDYLIFNPKDPRTKRPWKLAHIQASGKPCAKQLVDSLPEDGTYMICAVNGTKLGNAFTTLLGQPSSTAQIISYGMENVDFNQLSTNEI